MPGVEVFPEYIAEEGYYELVNLDELDTIVETVSKLKKWFDCITNGKNLLRNIGKYLIIMGIIIIIGAISLEIVQGVSVYEKVGIIAFFGYSGSIIAYKLQGNARAYLRTITEIDEAYKKVQKRSMDI